MKASSLSLVGGAMSRRYNDDGVIIQEDRCPGCDQIAGHSPDCRHLDDVLDKLNNVEW